MVEVHALVVTDFTCWEGMDISDNIGDGNIGQKSVCNPDDRSFMYASRRWRFFLVQGFGLFPSEGRGCSGVLNISQDVSTK